jgi:hypothetical protein
MTPEAAAQAPTVSGRRTIFIYAQAGVVTLAAICMIFYFSFSAEDAYITYRYSETLVDTGALVYNAGETINAMTSPLHALLSAVMYFMTGQTVLSNKIAAVSLLLVSTLLVWRRFNAQPHWQLLVLILIIMPPSILLWTFGGLETPVLLFLATLTVVLADRSGPFSLKLMCGLGTLTGLAFLTRYDSILFFLPILLYATLKSRSLSHTVAASVAASVFPLAWFAISRGYYGDLLPTSFYVKTPNGNVSNLLYNGQSLAAYLVYTGLVPAVALALVLLKSSNKVFQVVHEQLKRRWWLYLGLALEMAYGLSIATHHMMFSSRYFVPYVPAAVLVVVELVRRGAEASSVDLSSRHTANVLLALFGALLALQLYQEAYTYSRSINGIAPVGEYRAVGIRDYGKFMQLLSQEALDMEAHWQQVGVGRARPPRILTYAAGILPYVFRESYIYEKLVSYRHCHQRIDQGLYADYLHIIAPRHGPVSEQLPGPDENFTLVSSYDLYFDGAQQQLIVYYNPRPLENNLRASINAHCQDGE